MASNWKESIPRKIRRVNNGKGDQQFLISLPSTIANRYSDDAEFVASVNFVGQIVLTPLGDVTVLVKDEDGSAHS